MPDANVAADKDSVLTILEIIVPYEKNYRLIYRC